MCELTVKFLRPGVILLALLGSGGVAAETFADPTQPPDVRIGMKTPQSGKTMPRWQLSSTMIATDRRVATINGKRVAVGQQVNGATVVAIEPSWVVLQPAKSATTLTLQLLPNEFKRTAERELNEN